MADNVEEIIDEAPANPAADTEMAEAEQEDNGASALPYAQEDPDSDEPPRTPFAEYLSSPVVTLTVGIGDAATILTAHQAILIKSPFFQEAAVAFDESRTVDLPSEDVGAVGSFLEFLYTGDYFPRRIPGQRQLEPDPSLPDGVDEQGTQLLKHARIYTLADKFNVPALKALSSSKIHSVNSSAKGEIAYARYVYQYVPADDTALRLPITNYWATRSHTLRVHAEDEFRSLCLEFPQFGYDVLTRVLDEKLKRENMSKMHPAAAGSARKRPRHSNV